MTRILCRDHGPTRLHRWGRRNRRGSGRGRRGGLGTAPHAGAFATATVDGVNTPQFAELTPFKDSLRTPVTLRPSADGMTEIAMVEAAIRLHSHFPPTRMWTYNGAVSRPHR